MRVGNYEEGNWIKYPEAYIAFTYMKEGIETS